MQDRKMKNLGFTLTEALIATTILVVAILAIIQLFPIGIKTEVSAKENSVATHLGQDKTEEMLSKNYEDIDSESRLKVNNDPQSPFYIYEIETIITLVDEDLNLSGSDLGLKQISIKVYWQEEGEEKNVTISTLASQR